MSSAERLRLPTNAPRFSRAVVSALLSRTSHPSGVRRWSAELQRATLLPLAHPAPENRRYLCVSIALDLLAGLDPQETIALSTGAMRSPHGRVRLRTIELLANTEQAEERTVLQALGAAMVDKDMAVKQYAIRALAERGGPEALGYLRQSLHDSDPSVRMATVENIVRSAPSGQALTLLEEATLNDNEEVRSAASAWVEQLSQNSQETSR